MFIDDKPADELHGATQEGQVVQNGVAIDRVCLIDIKTIFKKELNHLEKRRAHPIGLSFRRPMKVQEAAELFCNAAALENLNHLPCDWTSVR